MKLRAWCKDDDALLGGTLAEPALRCPECKKEYPLRASDALRAGKIEACALCGYGHFHIRKEFPRRLGLAIVLVAAALCFTNIFPPGLFFLPLIIASVIDLLLYVVLPWKVVCYVCEAEYLGATIEETFKPYDLETATECKRLRWPKPVTAGGQ